MLNSLRLNRKPDEGILGQIYTVNSAINTHIKPSNWRAQKKTGGGELYDWGAHLVDQILQLIPSEPKSIFAIMDNRGWDVEVDTYDRIMIQFQDGTLSEIETSNISWIPRPRWYVLGEKGNLIFSDGKFRLRTAKEDREIYPQKGNENEFYTNVSEVFNHEKELIVKPQESRKVVLLVEASIRAAQEGKVIEI